jgi:hypothetical protein
VALSDTSPKAQEVYFRLIAQMTPAERVRMAVRLWETAHSLQWAAARRQNPAAGEAEIAFRIAASRFGVELARRAYKTG